MLLEKTLELIGLKKKYWDIVTWNDVKTEMLSILKSEYHYIPTDDDLNVAKLPSVLDDSIIPKLDVNIASQITNIGMNQDILFRPHRESYYRSTAG